MPIMLEKDRAKKAWDRIHEIREKSREVQKRYRSQVRGGPAMVQRNGLGQFLAFLASSGFSNGALTTSEKNERDHADGLLYQHLGAWLLKQVGGQANEPNADQVRPGAVNADPLHFLLDHHTTMEQSLWATREALAFLQWARRFAESQLEEPDTQGK